EVTGDIGIAAAQPLLSGADMFLSAGRSFTSAGLVGTAASLVVQAPLGLTSERLSSGGITFLGAAEGPLTVSIDLASTGLVSAAAEAIDLTSLGGLAFAVVDATAGALSTVTAGNLTIPTASAPGPITLRSTGGSLIASGSVNAGGNVMAEGLTGVTVPVLISGGRS